MTTPGGRISRRRPPSLEVLGFDPYRFDHARMAQVIRCVLGEHFGLPTGGR